MPERRTYQPLRGRPLGDSLLAFLVLVTAILCGFAFLAWQIILPVIGLLWLGGAI